METVFGYIVTNIFHCQFQVFPQSCRVLSVQSFDTYQFQEERFVVFIIMLFPNLQ